jgi:sterol desaturase/sphingolipid hydroxylase (fatty acid hydroxylase superfamily)
MSLWIANSLLLLMVLLEVLLIKYHQKEEIPWKEITSNLNSGHIVLWVFRGVEIAAFHIVLQYASLDLLAHWNIIAIWLFSYVAWDFCFYWMHRLHHTFETLWAVHSIHHEGEHFSLSLGIRNSWYSSLTNFPFVVILAIVGVPLEVFITVSSINYFIQFYNHNGFIKKSGFLEYFLVTPSHHKVHHGSNDVYVDKNFGGTFIIWDQLFGTYQPEIDSEPVQLGIANHPRTDEIITMNNLPILKYLGFKKQHKGERISKTYTSLSIGITGILSFSLLLVYIAYEKSWAWETKGIYFLIVFISALSSGLLAENKQIAYVLWLLNSGFFLVFVLYNNLPLFYGIMATAVLIVAGVYARQSYAKPTTSS